jgi:polyisoprenoid-binding protein YceI
MESHQFPSATFKGNIEHWLELDLGLDPQDVSVMGTLTLHGVSRKISESVTIARVGDRLNGLARFEVAPADYGIQIPKIVRNNIARIIEVTVNVKLQKK